MGVLISKPGITSASTLSIPKDWSPSWFRNLIDNQLKGADVRNAVGSGGIQVSGNIASPYATISYAPGALVWSSLSLGTNVSNFGSGWQTAQYTKTPEGRVILRGLIAGTGITVGSVLASLPIGYRPVLNQMFVAPGTSTTSKTEAAVQMLSSGNVVLDSTADGTNPTFWLSLNSIEFYLN